MNPSISPMGNGCKLCAGCTGCMFCGPSAIAAAGAAGFVGFFWVINHNKQKTGSEILPLDSNIWFVVYKLQIIQVKNAQGVKKSTFVVIA